MVSTRFSSFLLIMFILLNLRNSSSASVTHQGEEGISKDFMAGVNKTRKMMILKKVVLRKEEQANYLNTEDVEAKINFSGAAHDNVGSNCNHKSGKGSNFRRGRRRSHYAGHPLKDKRVVFTVFSADYHVPKSHPPKNN